MPTAWANRKSEASHQGCDHLTIYRRHSPNTPAIERRRGTINKVAGNLCGKGVLHRAHLSQGSQSCLGGCAATWIGWGVTVENTIHDKKANLMQKGVGGGPLRHELRARFGEIYHQASTKDSKMEGRVEFKSNYYYKIPWGSFQVALGFLRIEVVQSSESQATLPPVSARLTESSINTMSRTRVRIMGGSQEPRVT